MADPIVELDAVDKLSAPVAFVVALALISPFVLVVGPVVAGVAVFAASRAPAGRSRTSRKWLLVAAIVVAAGAVLQLAGTPASGRVSTG